MLRKLTPQEIAADKAAVDAMISKRLQLIAADKERQQIKEGKLADRGLILFN